MADPPRLTLVGSTPLTDYEQEFVPLPYYAWDERPASLPLDQEEAATAIHLSQGHLPRAADLLKVPLVRLNRFIARSPRLQRVADEAADLVVAKAFSKYIEALDDPEPRRQEWGAAKVMQSRVAQGHPFSPAPASTSSASSSVTISQQSREIVFQWKSPALPGDVVDAG